MNDLIIDIARKSIYDKAYILDVMAKDYIGKYFGFNKKTLEELFQTRGLKISTFIKQVYKKDEQKNKTVQISKLLNKKDNQAKYFTDLDLANDLAHFANMNKKPDENLVSPEYFLGQRPQIKCIGALTGNGQVNLYKKKDMFDIFVLPKYADCVCIINKTQLLSGMIMVFKDNKFVDTKADNRLSFCQDSKSKIVYHGYLELLSNGNYDVIDRSVSTGKKIGVLAENISLSWSSQALSGFFPSQNNS